MAVIADFIVAATGGPPTNEQRQAAIYSGNYGGLTPIGEDGQAVPANSPLSPELQKFRQDMIAGLIPSPYQTPNYLLYGAIAFAVWYLFIRRK
jgi:hypothetical protein